MTIQRSLSLITFFTIFFWLVWLTFFFLIEPHLAGVFGLVIFFFSLFCAILSTLTLLLTILRLRFLKNKEEIFFKMALSFRQATWLAVFLVGLLLLKTFKLFNELSGATLFFLLLLFELLFSLRKKKIVLEKEE